MTLNKRLDDTLELIDGALGDWEVSQDAMRWTPEEDAPAVKSYSALSSWWGSMQSPGWPLRVITMPNMPPDTLWIGPTDQTWPSVSFTPCQAENCPVCRYLRPAEETPEQQVSTQQRAREHALEQRRNRNTGPDRQIQHQNRPRRHHG